MPQRLNQWAALRCKEPQFLRFLGATDEAEAADVVRIVCNIQSRGELDTSADAADLFHRIIRRPCAEFLKGKGD